MKRVTAAAALLLLWACERPQPATTPSAGSELERAARAAGMVADPDEVAVAGVFQADGDLACLLPRNGQDNLIGLSVDYGEGQHCVARGTAAGSGRLSVDLGEACRFTAQLEAERLVVPATLPRGCEAFCVGRATLAAMGVARLSSATAEAARVRGADGKLLCPD